MDRSLASAFDNLSQIDKKEPENNMRSMMSSLSQSIDKVWQTDKKKISQIDKKDWKNEFIGSMRSIMASLSQSIDKVSEANKRYRLLNEVKSFLIHIDFAIEISINFLYY